eukprot:5259183-Amphidinium_carterae.1
MREQMVSLSNSTLQPKAIELRRFGHRDSSSAAFHEGCQNLRIKRQWHDGCNLDMSKACSRKAVYWRLL